MTLLSTLALTSAIAGGGGLSGALEINEIRIDQPGSDNDEYFELKGDPSLDLTNVYYIVIGDGSGGSGVVESVTDLTGSTVASTGYFVAAESGFSLGTADLTTSLGFENSDNVTHMLVLGFTGTLQDDLDLNDDGFLDIQPWSDVVDVVSLVEKPYAEDKTYAMMFGGASVGPDGTFVPGHVFKCTAGWQIGEFGPGTTDTPGGPNSPMCPGPRINEIRIDQPSSDNDEYFELLTEPGADLSSLSYIVIGDGSGGSGVVESITDLAGLSTGPSGIFLAAESTFSLGATPDLTTSLGFENSDNVTHLLVSDFTGVLQEDLDTDDDGILDITPWTEVIDAVSLVESPGSGDQYYAVSLGFSDVGPDGTFVPGQAIRCNGEWRYGSFVPNDPTFDTPGFQNLPCNPGVERCYATSIDPINLGILAIEGSCSLQLNNTSVFAYELPVDSFGVMIAGFPDTPSMSPFGANCIGSGPSAIRLAFGFASGGELSFPIDLEDAVYAPLGTGGSGIAVGDVLAFQYLYRDNSAPNGARFSDAVAFEITP
ncbi:MAG: hypothetical protein P8R43_09680 [Planctomycetota bacterium]|nr:hypothetical protein [Planctomycetota bacterium]